MRRVLTVLAILATTTIADVASAAVRVAVAPLRGKGGADCATLVAQAIAGEVQVIPWTEVKTGASFRTYPELSKWLEKSQKTIGADIVIFGNVLGRGVILEAYDVRKRALVGLRKIASRSGCRLSRRGTSRIAQWISTLDPTDAAPPPRRPPPPRAPPPPPPVEPPEPRHGDLDTIEETPPPPPVQTSTVVNERLEPPPSRPRLPRRRPLLIEAELEIGVHRRTLGFSGVRTRNLRAFDIGAMPVPGIAVRVFFLRGLDTDWLSPVFLRTRFARAAFLSARRPDGGEAHDAVHDRVEARFGYRFRVPASIPVLISPSVGLHVMRFLVGSSDDGPPELDLPNVSYVSAYLGADVEALVAKRATLAVSAAFLPVLSGGPILSPGYFENGSAQGLTIEAGLRYAVHPRISVSMMGDFLKYSLSLDAPLTSTRVAQSGSDTVLGIRFGTRASF